MLLTDPIAIDPHHSYSPESPGSSLLHSIEISTDPITLFLSESTGKRRKQTIETRQRIDAIPMKQHALQTNLSSTEETNQMEMPKSFDQSVNVLSDNIPQRKQTVVVRENSRQLNYYHRNTQKIKKLRKQRRIAKTYKKFKVDHIDMYTSNKDAIQTIPKRSRQSLYYHKKKSEILARKRERYAQNKKSKRINAK